MKFGTRNLLGNSFKLDIPKPRADLLKFNYVYGVIKRWNGLPTFVCAMPSFAVFKKKLSRYMNDNVICFFAFVFVLEL